MTHHPGLGMLPTLPNGQGTSFERKGSVSGTLNLRIDTDKASQTKIQGNLEQEVSDNPQ